jgi:ornithine cyclodeaminase/alanine dehydrogenase-like protein (mu-crystallin family)
MTLLLKRHEVSDLLDMRQAIQLIETVFLEQANGNVQAWAPFVLGHDDYELRVNAGSLSGRRLVGLRAGMGKAGSQLLLYSTREERLLAIMAYPIGYYRVGATVGLAVDRLAKGDARCMVMVGTGRIASLSLEAIACLRKFETVLVHSRTDESRQNFCSMASRRFSIQAHPVSDLEPAVRQADVVVVATSAVGSVIRGSWLAEGAHVSTAGIRHEIDDETYLRAQLVVVASREQEERFIADRGTDNILLRLLSEGKLHWRDIPELGEVVSGKKVRPSGISVFRESQGGFGDIILAHRLYERAKELGRGIEINFNE